MDTMKKYVSIFVRIINTFLKPVCITILIIMIGVLVLYILGFKNPKNYSCVDITNDEISVYLDGNYSFIRTDKHDITENAIEIKGDRFKNGIGASGTNIRVIIWNDRVHGILYYRPDKNSSFESIPIVCTEANFLDTKGDPLINYP